MTFYLYTTLDDPSATAGTYAQGVNAAGQIVGYYNDSQGSHGFLLDDGTYTTFSLVTQATRQGTNGYYQSQSASTAEAINDSGQITGSGFWDDYGEIGEYGGGASEYENFDSAYDAFSANTAGSTWSEIQAPINGAVIEGTPSYVKTYGFGINSAGDVVGYYTDLDGSHGFLDPSGTTNPNITEFNYPGVSGATYAHGINDEDLIVGYFIGTDPNQTSVSTAHGFLYNNGAFAYFDDPSAVNGTYAEAINNSDVIVGYYVDANAKSDGFIFNEPTGTYTTFDITGAADTYIYGINNAGEIVGAYVDGAGKTHGFEAVPLPANGGNNDIWVLSGGQWEASAQPGSHPAGSNVAAIGDWTGGGTDGILWFNPTTGDTDEWQMSNAGWAASVDLGSHPGGFQIAGVGDFTGNGIDDVLWTNASGSSVQIDIWELNSNGKWANSVSPGSHPAGYEVAGIGDTTGNGTSDILWYNPTSGDVDEWLIANGKWSASIDLGSHPGSGWQVAGVGDFTGNGTDDVLWFNSGTGQTDIWELANGQWAASVSPGTHPLGYEVAAVGNFAGTGTDGILWYNPSTGDTDEWQLSNGKWAASVDLGTHSGGFQIAGAGNFINGSSTSDILWHSSS